MLSPLQLSDYTIDELSVVANLDCSETGGPSDWTISVLNRHLTNTERPDEHLIVLEAKDPRATRQKKHASVRPRSEGHGTFQNRPRGR